MISFHCPRCGTFLTAGDDQAGSHHACASCGHVATAPSAQGATAPVSASSFSGRPSRPGSDAASPGARLQAANGRQVVYWPCSHCRLGLNTPYENVGLSIECPGCKEAVSVPDPLAHLSPSQRAEAVHVGSARPRNNNARLLAAAVVGAAVVVGVVIGLLVWQPWTAKTLSADHLRFLPDGAQLVATLDVQGLVNSEAYKKADHAVGELLGIPLREFEGMIVAQTGLGWSDIQRVTIGASYSDQKCVIVVKAIKDMDPRRFLKGIPQEYAFEEVTVKGFKILKQKGRPFRGKSVSFCLVEPTLAVFAEDLDTLQAVLARNGPPLLAADVQASMAHTDFSKTFALAMGKIAKDLVGSLSRDPLADELMEKVAGLSMELEVDDTIRINLTGLCTDGKIAKELHDRAENGVENVQRITTPELRKVLHAFRFSHESTTVSMAATLDPDDLISLVKKGVGVFLARR